MNKFQLELVRYVEQRERLIMRWASGMSAIACGILFGFTALFAGGCTPTKVEDPLRSALVSVVDLPVTPALLLVIDKICAQSRTSIVKPDWPERE